MKYNNKKHTVLMLLLTILFTVLASGVSAQSYKLVTSMSDLAVDDEVIIVNEYRNVAMGGIYDTQYSDQRKLESVTITNHSITNPSVNVSRFKLVSGSANNTYRLLETAGPQKGSYLCRINGGWLSQKSTADTYCNFSLSIATNGNATMSFTQSVNQGNSYRIIGVMTAGSYDNTYVFDCSNTLNTNNYPQIYKKSSEITTLTFPEESYQVEYGQEFTSPTATLSPEISGAVITYSSSDTNVATVDADGTVTILAPGITTITANYAGNENYEASTDSYTLTVIPLAAPTFSPIAGTYIGEQKVTIKTTTANAKIYYTEDGSEPSATNGTEYTGPITVSSSKTIKAVTVKYGKQSEVSTAEYVILTPTTLTFPQTQYQVNVGQHFDAPVATLEPAAAASGATITYTSDNVNVATVNASTGEVTLVGDGYANITATYSGTSVYGTSSATYQLTVMEEGETGTERYQLVNDESVLQSNDRVLIVYKESNSKYYAMGATPDGAESGRSQSEVTVTDNIITLQTSNPGPSRFTITPAAVHNSWYYYSKTNTEGYLYYNYSTLGVSSTLDNSKYNTIVTTVENGVATLGFYDVWVNNIISNGVNFTVSHDPANNIQIYRRIADNETLDVLRPVFTLNEGTYASAQTTKITCATEGATIYYTTDGTDPKTSDTRIQYTADADIAISESTTLRAAATVDGELYSPVTTVTYTIDANSSGYRITFYDASGTAVQTKTVTSVDNIGEFIMTDLNNDAVKFTIEPVKESSVPTALIQVELELEPLNPYVQRFEVQATAGGKTVTQDFTTDDFTAGEGITFGVPKAMHQSGLTITFDDLYNLHADQTYGDPVTPQDPGYARHFFVKSDFYDTTHGTNYGTDANADYTDKIATEYAGNQPFYFNNADKLIRTEGTGDFTTYLIDYAFEETNGSYRISDTSASGGTLGTVAIPSSTNDKTVYLFTGDYPRYNIAQTTATQHKSHAFYELKLHLDDQEYEPVITYNKIYDRSFHGENATKEDTTPFYGIVVKGKVKGAADSQISDNAFLFTDDVISKLEANTAVKKDHILYVDASSLKSLAESSEDALKTFIGTLGKNALVFLPFGVTSGDGNFASKTISGSFNTAGNIIITDKEPFFSPYDIQVPNAFNAEYKRVKSKSQYADYKYSSVMLPFGLKDVRSGNHTDYIGNVTMMEMNSGNAMSDKNAEGTDGAGALYFHALSSDVTETEGNTPYIFYSNEIKLPGYIFAVRQNGALIKATPQDHVESIYYPALSSTSAQTSTGSYGGSSIVLTHRGTYSGAVLNKSEKLLYFGNKSFQTPQCLQSTTLKIYPFRSVYTYTNSGTNPLAKQLSFDLVLGENPFEDVTGIEEVGTAERSGAIRPGIGTITIIAGQTGEYTIHTSTGMMVDRMNLEAGESHTTRVPAGIYIVDGVKVMVK